MTSSAEQELRRSVGWTVTDPSPARIAGRVLGGLLHAVSTVVSLTGAWLALAGLGSLAGWPEPAPTS